MRALLVLAVLGVVAVAAAPAKSGPAARFKATPKSPLAGQRVKLDARATKCKRCRYRWHQIRGGKARKLGKGKGRVLRVRFKTAGVKRIRLTVTDRKGRRDGRTRKLRVRRAAGVPVPGTPAPGVAPKRTGCFADPSACGYPDQDNTGPTAALQTVPGAPLPAGASWDAGARTLRITGDNVLIQNLDIPGSVAVDGDNATIQNSRIATGSGCSSPCGGYGVRLGQADSTVTGTVLQNLDIVTAEQNPGDDNPRDPATIDTKVDHGVRNNGDRSVIADHLFVKGFGGAWKGPGTIRDSYLFSQLVFAGDHVEAYLNGGEGDPSILQHNTILNPVAQTAAISFFNDFGGIGRVDIVGNLLAGGGYVMYGGAKNGNGNVTGPILVKDNRIARGNQDSHGYYRNGGQFGLWAEFDRAATVSCGNYWDDTLAAARNPDSRPC